MRACVMTRNGAFEIDLTEKGRCISERFRKGEGFIRGIVMMRKQNKATNGWFY